MTNASAHEFDDVPARRGRVIRIDRGWSTIRHVDGTFDRVRNIDVEVAVGDDVLLDENIERVVSVRPRRSALVRRASFEGSRGVPHVVAANIDVVFLVHTLASPVNERRVERELVLAFDSGAAPVVVLTKSDIAREHDIDVARRVVEDIAFGVPTHVVSATSGEGLDALRAYAHNDGTVAMLGASGVGKSTLVNALVGADVQRTGEVREGDQRGRHTTVAAELVPLPSGGWLLDTPGLRAVNLWTSGRGIEQAFGDVFALADQCKFRDCKHLDEPDCAVTAAIARGDLRRERLASMRRLVAEEHALEEEQREREKSFDRRGARRPPPGRK